MDPQDTRVLDDIVRFVGQKVAAVIAKAKPPRRKGADPQGEYEIRGGFDPNEAIAPGAPVIHGDKRSGSG